MAVALNVIWDISHRMMHITTDVRTKPWAIPWNGPWGVPWDIPWDERHPNDIPWNIPWGSPYIGWISYGKRIIYYGTCRGTVHRKNYWTTYRMLGVPWDLPLDAWYTVGCSVSCAMNNEVGHPIGHRIRYPIGFPMVFWTGPRALLLTTSSSGNVRSASLWDILPMMTIFNGCTFFVVTLMTHVESQGDSLRILL